MEHIRGHYPKFLFRLDMGLVYRPFHRWNDVEKNPEKYVNYFIIVRLTSINLQTTNS
jgi:hypothetical protein